MSEWKSITIWERYKKDSRGNWHWEHNHIEDGFDPTRTEPTPVDDNQRKAWNGANWRAIEGVMTDQYEVIVEENK